MEDKKLKKILKRAKKRQNTLKNSKILDLDFTHLKTLLNYCIRDIRKKRPTSYNYKALVRFFRENGKLKHEVVGYIKDKNHIQNLIDYVYHSNFIMSNYERKSIENFIDKNLIDYIYKKDLTKEAFAQKIIDKFQKIHIWDILFPLGNINLEVSNFKLGNHKIIKFTKYQNRMWKNHIKSFISVNQVAQSAKFQLEWFDLNAKNFLNEQVCTIIQVKKGDADRALDESKIEFELFLSCLKFMSYMWYPDYKQYSIFVPGQNYNKTASYVGFSQTGGLIGQNENKNPSTFDITKHTKQRFNDLGLYKLSNLLILEKDKRNNFQNNILTAIRIYGDAVSSSDLAQSYVKLVTVLELLLIFKEKSKSNILAERLSLLMRRNYNERQYYFYCIKGLYELRNKIVHEGKTDIKKNEYKNIHIVVYNLLLLLININDKFKDKNEFLKKIEEVKFGKKYTFKRNQIYLGTFTD